MKRDPRDQLFSKLVRCRSNWVCERCGKQYEPNSQGLHASHLFGRRRRSVRWAPDNAAAHCFSCHNFLGENPRIFSRWITEHLGSEKADFLETKANTLVKWSKSDLEDIRKQLKSEWVAMQKMRDTGYEGRIEFHVPLVEDI